MSKYTVSNTELIDRANFFCKNLFGLPFNLPVQFMENEPGTVVGGVFSHKRDEEGDYEGTTGAIEINERFRHNPLKLNDVLLHELTHYKCWFTGLDHKDGTKDFEEELKKFHITSNYVLHYKKDGKTYDDNYHLPWMEKYEAMYQEHLKSSPKRIVRVTVGAAGNKEFVGTASVCIKTGRISNIRFTYERPTIPFEGRQETPLLKELKLSEIRDRHNSVWVEFYGCEWEIKNDKR